MIRFGGPTRKMNLNNCASCRLRVCGLDSAGSGLGLVVSYCEHGIEPPAFIKGEECLEWFSNFQLP